MNKRIISVAILICLLFSCLTIAQTSKPTFPKGFNPNAPKEMLQFSFLVGEFSCVFKTRINQKGDYNITTGNKWVGYYTLGGYAFQDDYYSSGSLYRGTTWRTYDSTKKRWVNMWLQAGTDTPAGWTPGYFFGEKKDGKIVITSSGKDRVGEYIDLIHFYDIAKDSFKWKQDRSYDAGKTWIKNRMMAEAKRVKK